MSRCSSCGAEIIWTRSEKTGKPVPVDHAAAPEGTIALIQEENFIKAHFTTLDERERHPNRSLFVAHFATCPNAANHRRRRIP